MLVWGMVGRRRRIKQRWEWRDQTTSPINARSRNVQTSGNCLGFPALLSMFQTRSIYFEAALLRNDKIKNPMDQNKTIKNLMAQNDKIKNLV